MSAARWESGSSLGSAPYVAGEMVSADARRQPIDLLAVDAAYPRVVCPEQSRHDAHQAWQLGEVLLVDVDGRLAAAVPGVGFDCNTVCEAIRRVGRAVGAQPHSFTVSIVL
ncbi:MAG: hypothetical protein ACRDPG_12550 [Nocardioidaceae bacterium]